MTAPPLRPAATGRRRRRLLVVAMAVLPVVLGGCQVPAFWAFRGSTTQGKDAFNLWAGTFIAAIVVGVFVALLILWAVVRYRRRNEDMPKQFQYHIPLELSYTIVPIVIVLVLFGFTVYTENKVDLVVSRPALIVNVDAFQWGWEFQYPNHVVIQAETTTDPDPVGPAGLGGPPCAPADWCQGPGLVLPAGQTARIQLRSKDTVHGFYVPEFNFSRYAQPGVLNKFDFTVKSPGVYRAQCTQFCGLYHSLMLFHVVAMPPSQFQAWLASEQSTASNSGPAPNPSQNQTYVPTNPGTVTNSAERRG